MRKLVRKLCVSFFFVCSGITAHAFAADTSQSNENSKRYFFEVAGNPGWWAIWTNNFDANGALDPKLEKNVVDRSEWVKNILETDYGVKVPFSPHQGKGGCGSITPILLSYVVGAVTAASAPSLTYPNSEPGWVIKRASDDMEMAFSSLHAYCGSSDDFADAFQKFLDEYKVVIKTKADQQIAERLALEQKQKAEAEAAAAAALKEKSIADARAKAEEEKRLAKEKKRLALEAAEVAKAQEMEQQRQQAEALARKAEEDRQMEQIRQYRLAIKSGRQAVNTIRDGMIFYDAKVDDSVIWQPPVAANNKYYMATGRLSRIEGSDYIFEIDTYRGVKYFVGLVSNRTVITRGFEARFNAVASIVGNYVGTTTATMTSGETVNLPVFNVAVMGH